MKLPALVQRLLALVTLTTGAAFAQVEPPQPPMPESGGLSVSLTPGGYKFVVPPAGAMRRGLVAKASFPASVAVSNRSRQAVTFTFPDSASAEAKWTFRIFDEAGNEIWKSDSGVGTEVLTERKLVPGQTWRRLVQVPLRPNNTALLPGLYTLEASLDADKKLGASTIFEVVQGVEPPDPKQGIAGLVLRPADPPTDPASEMPAAGAYVQVQQILLNVPPGSPPPFVWTGRADDAGKFSVNTPPGRFRVTAAVSNTPGAVGLPPKTVEVTVEESKYTDVVIHLTAVQPPTQQGIRGLVLGVASNTTPGVPGTPLANANIAIEQIPNSANTPIFHWNGRSNAEGRFEAVTPVGRFKVTATYPPAPLGAVVPQPPPVVIEVNVEAGVFRQVTLQFISGNTP